MKNRSVTLSLLTATLFAIPAPAAEEPAAAAGRPPSRREQLIKRFDQNNDGQIDPAERQAAREKVRSGLRERWIRRFDRDGDGQLNDTEKSNARQAGQRLRHHLQQRMMHRQPAFGGPPAFRGPGGAGLHRPGGPGAHSPGHAFGPARGEIMPRFDRNGDGRLDETERQALRQAWEKFIQQQPPLKPAGS